MTSQPETIGNISEDFDPISPGCCLRRTRSAVTKEPLAEFPPNQIDQPWTAANLCREVEQSECNQPDDHQHRGLGSKSTGRILQFDCFCNCALKHARVCGRSHLLRPCEQKTQDSSQEVVTNRKIVKVSLRSFDKLQEDNCHSN